MCTSKGYHRGPGKYLIAKAFAEASCPDSAPHIQKGLVFFSCQSPRVLFMVEAVARLINISLTCVE